MGEETKIYNIKNNEVITLNENQFILSDSQGRIFGDDFNFIWPRMGPGINDFDISGSGNGSFEFTYRYPIKLGDCAIDVDLLNSIGCDGYPDYDDNTSSGGGSSSGGGIMTGDVYWGSIIGKPDTIKGYNITDAYTKNEVDQKISEVECDCDDVEIDEQALNDMLASILR